MGATDVVPFIPLEVPRWKTASFSHERSATRVGRELYIPVFLYERAAVTLAAARTSPTSAAASSTASATRLRPASARARTRPGADPSNCRRGRDRRAAFLVAYNVYLGDSTQMRLAREIARDVRESSGGLPPRSKHWRSTSPAKLGIDEPRRHRANFACRCVRCRGARRACARRRVSWSEIVGLVPERIALGVAERRLKLRDSLADHVLERQLLAVRARGPGRASTSSRSELETRFPAAAASPRSLAR